MRRHVLSEEREAALYAKLELRRALTNKKLMAEFGVSASTLNRIANNGPRVSRETKQKVSIDECLQELRA